jgi:hypothetical protein
LQQQNAVLNEIGKSVRNSEQNPPDEPWEDATCAQGLECFEQSPCQPESDAMQRFRAEIRGCRVICAKSLAAGASNAQESDRLFHFHRQNERCMQLPSATFVPGSGIFQRTRTHQTTRGWVLV